MIADPWAVGIAPEPRAFTRDDRVLAAAEAIFEAVEPPSNAEYLKWNEMPVFVRDAYMDDAAAALDVAYPLVESAEEIDALPQGTIIVNQSGTVMRREMHGGLARVDGSSVGTLEVWEQPGERETGRKPVRKSSATLAMSGPWTVVWTRVTA